jgi:hypothetical protein
MTAITDNRKRVRLLGPSLILLAAALATAPILFRGSSCGDDFEFHVVSWFDVQQSWLHGIPYPHWMPSANYGAGEPRFMFYPPLTWMLGAALGFVLPWQFVPIAMIFLFLAATGLAVRALALEALPDAPATLAGCAALFSGFALFTAYERTAFAELTGGFWIPLLLLFALRDRNPSGSLWRRVLDGSTLPLALLLAGCWLSDGPVGVMASYLLAAVALAAGLVARSWAHLIRASIAAALGIGLAAFYLVPAAREQRWVDLRAAVNLPVFSIENNWLFARHTEPSLAPYAMVLHRASVLAATMIGVALLGLLIVVLRRRFSDSRMKMVPSWWIPLAIIPVAVLFLQFPVSLPVWNLLPKLRFLQYPWRWVLVVEAPMAIFFAAAVWPARRIGCVTIEAAENGLARGEKPERHPSGAKAHVDLIAFAARLKSCPVTKRPENAVKSSFSAACIAAVCALVFLASTFFAARTFLRACGEGDTIVDLLEQFRAGGGLEGTDEYEPPDSDHWKIATGLPDACFSDDSGTTLGVVAPGEAIPAWHPEQGSCEATATTQLRQAEHLRFTTVAPHPGYLILRLLSYPAWRITVNGHTTDPAALDQRDDGLIAVPVPQGPVELAADWTTTPDVIAGRSLSSLALLLLIALGLLEPVQELGSR